MINSVAHYQVQHDYPRGVLGSLSIRCASESTPLELLLVIMSNLNVVARRESGNIISRRGTKWICFVWFQTKALVSMLSNIIFLLSLFVSVIFQGWGLQWWAFFVTGTT